MNCIVGIDPGKTGAIAILTSIGGLEVHNTPVLDVPRKGKPPKQRVDPVEVGNLLATMPQGCVAYVEDIHAMPKNGAVSMFNFGRSFGMMEGVLAGLQIPVQYVSPQMWMAALGVSRADYNARELATKLFPGCASLFEGAASNSKVDGRAEAALIAWYGRERLRSLIA